MVLKILVALIYFFTPVLLAAQDFNYVHYDTKDGLAGSTVYSMCQDKDGFMWFATENGLTRYDGTQFKNFTVKDGLPDNEVLKIFADSKGRVWIGTFSKELCFYYKGKIYNQFNNSLVRKLKFERNVENITEDDNHFLGLSFHSLVMIITPEDSVIKYRIEDIYHEKNAAGSIMYSSGKILLQADQRVVFFYNPFDFSWENERKIARTESSWPGYRLDSNYVGIKYDTGKNVTINVGVPGTYLSGEAKGDYMLYINTTDGSWSVDTNHNKLGIHYLAGKKISCSVEDMEKNLWFASLGEGVYKLPSQLVKTIVFSADRKYKEKEVFSITAYHDRIIAGGQFTKALLVDKNFVTSELDFNQELGFSEKNPGTNRLYSMKFISNSVVILGFDAFLIKLDNNKSLVSDIYTVKSIDKIDEDHILVGSSFYAFKMRLKDMQITDTIWRDRCTKVFYQDNKYYIGTLKGLYEVKEDKTFTYLGNLHEALTRRITDIKSSGDSIMWISTSDNGIIAFKNGKIMKLLTDNDGLSSNICRTLFIDGNTLWVGTDKGINKITHDSGRYHIVKYSTSDGLPSNTINALYIKDSIVWVGSPAGLTYFYENSISSTSICSLKMLGVRVSGKEINMDSAIHLSYQNNNIHFEYAGISFRSGGEITYFYKLTGLDKEWKTTAETILDYKSLPANEYKLELYAVNKYGIKSDTIIIEFSVAAPFWKTTWFYIILSSLAIAGIIFIFNLRNQKTRQRLEEKNNFQKQFAILEQQALQSQMNPHFIFNCLNSIQQYILTNEKEKANQYLTGFATLIRQTLDISAQKTITVAEEASYLKKYLDMERMRFGDSFNYNIHVDETANIDQVQIPALLLQPYVENCLRHGIRYKKEGAGKIAISFTQSGDNLSCTIQDNGIGRDKAAEFKSKQHIEYQSKGMSLTGKRIELLNAINESKIAVTVTDLKNNDNSAAGTLVEINIPI